MKVSKGLAIGAGLPLTYTMTPEWKFDGTALADSNTYLLTLAPTASLLLGKLPAIWEIGLGYTFPLLGKGLDAPAMHRLTLELKSYLRLFK
jgi:hypothetical protein